MPGSAASLTRSTKRRANASGPSGKHKVPQRAVRIPDEQWEQLGALAAKRGTDRNAIINELVAEYCGRITT